MHSLWRFDTKSALSSLFAPFPLSRDKPEACEEDEFYVRYYVGHKGKFGHEFLEFEFRPEFPKRIYRRHETTLIHFSSEILDSSEMPCQLRDNP